MQLEIVWTLMCSASNFEGSLNADVTYDPPPEMHWSRIVGSYIRAFIAAALPKHDDVSPPKAYFSHGHLDWLRDAVRASYRGETSEDSPRERAAQALDKESKNDIALRYQLDLWRRTEPEPEELDPSLADGYTLSDDSDFHAYVRSRSGTLLGFVRQRSDGLWEAEPFCTRQGLVLSSREQAIGSVVKRTTQLAHVFVNGQYLGKMYVVCAMNPDLKYVAGYPCGWDGSRYRFKFLMSHQLAIGDDVGFGFTDKRKDEVEPEGIGGHVVDTDEHVVYISDLWGMGWDGLNLRRLYGIRSHRRIRKAKSDQTRGDKPPAREVSPAHHRLR